MNDVKPNQCPVCGAPLEQSGICARCLLRLGLREESASGASEHATSAAADILTGAAGTEHPGDRFGPYKLVRMLGEGGMGTVYLAEQERPIRRTVALKVIKLGLDTPGVIARFESERQALALMDHPNIAKVYDAGASDRGRPYFVMEYVPGVPVTDYCDSHRLSTRDRLKLFLKVCQGVQHAHQKGVIHRDLKPSNILVMEREGQVVPKIIDFGLAKAVERELTQATVFTEAGILVGTPEYMSPEQISAGAVDIDTRSDVYALGLVLYELLVGAMPFDARELRGKGFDEIRRVIREEDPPRPTVRLAKLGNIASEVARLRDTDLRALQTQLRGDLEWIMAKAMEKDRARRYDGASDLAADVEAHLRDEPVSAGPASAFYLIGKFVRKNRLKVGAAAAVLLALLAGLTASTFLYFRAERQRVLADAQRVEATQQRQSADARRAEAEEQREIARRSEAEAMSQRLLAENREAANRRLLYASDINLAQRAWEESNFQYMKALLARHMPAAGGSDQRGFEWFHLWRLAHQDLVALPIGDPVSTLRFSADGRRIAAGETEVIFGAGRRYVVGPDAGALASVWNVQNGREVFRITAGNGKSAAARDLLFGEKSITVAAADGFVRRFDASTGRELDSTQVRRVREIREQGRVRRAVEDLVDLAALSPDGQFVALVTAREPDSGRRAAPVEVYQIGTGKLVFRLDLHILNGVSALTFSPDSKLLIVAITETPTVSSEATLRLIEVPQFAERPAIRMPGRPLMIPSRVACSPDGRIAAVGTYSGTIELWDLKTGKAVRTMSGHTAFVTSITFSPDGRRVASGANDRTVRLWDARYGAELMVLRGHSDRASHVAFSRDGRNLASGGWDKSVRVWDLADAGEPVAPASLIEAPHIMAATDDAAMIATLGVGRSANDGTVTLMEASGRVRATLKAQSPVLRVEFTPDMRTVITSSADRIVRLWDTVTGSQLHSLKHPAVAYPFAVSSDGKLLATAATADEAGRAAGEVAIWNLGTGAKRLTLPHEFPVALAFSQDGELLAVGDVGVVRLWHVASGRLLATLRGHSATVRAVHFSADRRLLVSGSADRSAKVWDIATKREIVSLIGHGEALTAVALSPNGTRIATAANTQMKLWRLPDGTPLGTFNGHRSSIHTLRFSSDGNLLTSIDNDGLQRFWRAAKASEVSARLRR